MPPRSKAKRGREALDPRVLPSFEATERRLGPAAAPGGIPEPPTLTEAVERVLSEASAGLTAAQSALLRALAQSCALRPHPTGRCEYRMDELSAWAGMSRKEISAEFPGLCATGLCELSAIGSRNPKPCVRLPWLPAEEDEGGNPT